ncbi:hypothetical protein [Alloactinosynnema sp. L-07]|uniref:hypothetical protein n=1 Tax=Alloactinosynnema sp. L-07 TaxID=1653480 RepID=UPI00065EF595|nr:hypothetical protein [Alloactinosynnema sp. L-07]CRK59212.1 hypothetical protein [Alloactinosynnema sp. L-07]
MTDTSDGRRQIDSPEAFRADLAEALRRGNLSLRQAEKKSGWAKSTIARAIKDGIPKLDLVIDVLTAAGVQAPELEEWRARHDRLVLLPPTPPVLDTAAPTDGPPPPRQRPPVRRRWLVLAGVGILVITAALSVMVTFFVTEPTQDQSSTAVSPPSSRPVAIVVQNKVAIGTELLEDFTPAYLSSKPIPFCGRDGCKLEDTDMSSGAALVVDCFVFGATMSNADLSSEGIDRNPHKHSSSRWYRALLPGDRSGYLAEVYVAPEYRGGLGLAECRG